MHCCVIDGLNSQPHTVYRIPCMVPFTVYCISHIVYRIPYAVYRYRT